MNQVKLKYDSVQLYTSTKVYKISGGLFSTLNKLLRFYTKERRSYKAGEYFIEKMEVEIASEECIDEI